MKIKIVIVFVSVILFTSCSSVSVVKVEKPVTTLSNDMCIDTFDEFAFSTPYIDGLDQKVYLPLAPWIKETQLPVDNGKMKYKTTTTRINNGHIEIWVQPYMPSGLYDSDVFNQYHYHVYTPYNKKWEEVPAKVDDSGVFVDRLYVDTQNRIWGRNAWSYKTENLKAGPLSYFDDISKTFKIDDSASSIPNGIYFTPGDITNFMKLDEIYLDKSGVFWVFVHKDAIYSFNPNTYMVKRHVSLSSLPEIHNISYSSIMHSFILDVWDITDPIYLERDRLLSYNVDTEKILKISLPKDKLPSIHSILVDDSGRLWLDSFGWFDTNGSWVQFNPLMKPFLEINKRFTLWRYYAPPSIIFESTNGRLWFSIPRSDNWQTLKSGLAWYEPKTNSGCWFTSEGYDVIEDGSGAIWMVAVDHLYSYR